MIITGNLFGEVYFSLQDERLETFNEEISLLEMLVAHGAYFFENALLLIAENEEFNDKN